MKIVFIGDLSASGIFYKNIEEGKEILDNRILNIFKNANFTHVNLENPITNKQFRTGKKGAKLKAPLKLGDFLKQKNINICDLANNHIMDCGKEGIQDTIQILNKKNIFFYGIGKFKEYSILEYEDMKIALIASSHKEGPMGNRSKEGSYYLSNRKIKKIVKNIKKSEKVDFIIYNFHGGTEFNTIPEPKRRRKFHKLIGFGVDIVIGHHSHVPQGVEELDNRLIIYSLGNFCFDLPYHKDYLYTDLSFFVELTLHKNKKINLKKHYYKICLTKGKIELIPTLNNDLTEFFEGKIQVFDDPKSYYNAWIKEAYNVYLNKKSNNKISIKNNINIKNSCKIIKNIQINNFTQTILVFIKILNDIRRPNKRSLLFGSIRYILKYGIDIGMNK